MAWALALIASGVLAPALGYAVHRWWLVVGLLAVGITAIVIDIATRSLVGAGHDDRGPVAIVEGIFLIALAILLATGTAVGKRRKS